ncbi:MAG: class I SAM-dependent methyltransferase [Armatimonadetes bacterium]|nr:class I SAM-dependent methyltransferase [Armatimonadota bacterium]
MEQRFEAPDWQTYRMDMRSPHRQLEPLERESEVVAEALRELAGRGILHAATYDEGAFLRFREAVAASFEIPWTAITPRMQRLIWAINAIRRPKRMLAAGVFCGNTFICNAGAAVGPGAVYSAEDLVGVEIVPEEAARAERNVRMLDPTGTARIIAADAVAFAAEYGHPIDLLYLDADGAGGRGKGVYLDILEAAWDRLPKGAIVLAHNSVNLADTLRYYLEFVRDPRNMAASLNCAVDGEGLEVSLK